MTVRLIVSAAAIGCCALAFSAPHAAAKTCDIMQKLDSDNDGTLDLAEAKKLASAAFAKINKDSDKTLEANELKGRLSSKELKKADPDDDKSLDEAEYLALVEARFAAANPDKDGTIDCNELNSKDGKALLKLIK